MNKNIQEKIVKGSVSLEKYGINNLAWSLEDVKFLINSIMDDKIGILGGDVYKLTCNRLVPLYDNWSCEFGETETKGEFYIRSKMESLEYIENYPALTGEKVIFSITFTEEIDM